MNTNAKEQVADILKEYATFNSKVQERLRAALGYEKDEPFALAADSTVENQGDYDCKQEWKGQNKATMLATAQPISEL